MKNIDLKFMETALTEAQKTGRDVPVGAVLACGDKVIAKAHNRKEAENNPIAHAEVLVISEACQKLRNWRLDNTVLYVTLEPCPMCASAILYARIPKIVFGAYDSLYGAFGSTINMPDLIKFSPEIIGGIFEEDCSRLLKDFFVKQRNKG